VRDAVATIGNAVSLVNSVPMMADRAPRLAALDETFNRLEELSADATQLRGTLRALVVAQKSDVTAETVATLDRLTQRIDTRLGEVQAKVQGMQADIAALQVRVDTRKSQLLFVFNLLAVLCTMMLAWDHLQPSRRRPAPLGSSAAVRDQSGAQRRASAYRRLSA